MVMMVFEGLDVQLSMWTMRFHSFIAIAGQMVTGNWDLPRGRSSGLGATVDR